MRPAQTAEFWEHWNRIWRTFKAGKLCSLASRLWSYRAMALYIFVYYVIMQNRSGSVDI